MELDEIFNIHLFLKIYNMVMGFGYCQNVVSIQHLVTN